LYQQAVQDPVSLVANPFSSTPCPKCSPALTRQPNNIALKVSCVRFNFLDGLARAKINTVSLRTSFYEAPFGWTFDCHHTRWRKGALASIDFGIIAHLAFDTPMVIARTTPTNIFLQDLFNYFRVQLLPTPRGKKPRSVAAFVLLLALRA
jgi:hypothetical protein